MAIIERTSRITRREDVTDKYIVARCKKHGERPKVLNIYTGKREKLQGAIVECPCCEDCTVFSYDAAGAVSKWNVLNITVLVGYK